MFGEVGQPKQIMKLPFAALCRDLSVDRDYNRKTWPQKDHGFVVL